MHYCLLSKPSITNDTYLLCDRPFGLSHGALKEKNRGVKPRCLVPGWQAVLRALTVAMLTGFHHQVLSAKPAIVQPTEEMKGTRRVAIIYLLYAFHCELTVAVTNLSQLEREAFWITRLFFSGLQVGITIIKPRALSLASAWPSSFWWIVTAEHEFIPVLVAHQIP